MSLSDLLLNVHRNVIDDPFLSTLDALKSFAAEYEEFHAAIERLQRERLILERQNDRINNARLRTIKQEIESLQEAKDLRMAQMDEIIAPLVNHPEALLRITGWLETQGILINAADNIENQTRLPTPVQRLEESFIRLIGLPESQPGGTLTQKEVQANIAALSDRIRSMLFNLVMTAHPTNFQTVDALRFEHAFSELPQACETQEEFVEAASNLLRYVIDRMNEGVELTPTKPVTLHDETTIENEAWAILETQFNRLGDYLREAVRRLTAEGGPYADYREAFTPVLSAIYEKQANGGFLVKRSWLRAADADGRFFSNAIALYEGLIAELRPSRDRDSYVYTGPTLDLRQNMEVHRNWLGASVASLYNEHCEYAAWFRGECETFIRENGDPDRFKTSKSLYHELTPSQRLAFVRKLIRDDIVLLPREGGFVPAPQRRALLAEPSLLAKETAEFMNAYQRILQDVIREFGLPPHTTVQSMKKYSPEQETLFRRLDEAGFRLDDDGLNFSRTDWFLSTRGWYMGRKKPAGPAQNEESTETIRQISITGSEQAIMIDITRRLSIVNEMIDRFGPSIATRHQIANFSEPANFYELMIAMRETGLIAIEQNRVVQAKMDIMPLLETLDDLDHAADIYRELLKDPLFNSYIQARGGIVNIMVGFSDGAKSGGNFAAQWKIRQTVTQLSNLFAEYGYGSQFFDGQGHNIVRGGTLEPGIRPLIDSPAVGRTGILDMTIQSSMPNQMTTSGAKAADAVASKAIGVLEAQKAAETIAHLSESQQQAYREYELLITYIAGIASETFISEVKERPEALAFVSFWPKNKHIASRKGRGEVTAMPGWEAKRAIDTEFGCEMQQLPAHHVGLKEGLEDVIRRLDAGQPIPVKDPSTGKTIRISGLRDLETGQASADGLGALQMLYKHHAWFRAMMDLTEIGLERTDPVIAKSWAGLAQQKQNKSNPSVNIEAWVDHTLTHLDALGALAAQIAGRAAPELSQNSDYATKPERQRRIIGVVSNAIMTGIIRWNNGIPNPDTQPELVKAVFRAQEAAVEDYNHTRQPDHLRDLGRYAPSVTPHAGIHQSLLAARGNGAWRILS